MQDLVRRAGIEPGPPALGAQSLIHWATREVPAVILCCDSEAHILWVLAYLLLYLYVILFVLYFLSFLSGTLKCICPIGHALGVLLLHYCKEVTWQLLS